MAWPPLLSHYERIQYRVITNGNRLFKVSLKYKQKMVKSETWYSDLLGLPFCLVVFQWLLYNPTRIMTQASDYTQASWEWHLLLFQRQEQKEQAKKAGLVYTRSVSETLQLFSFIVLFISTTLTMKLAFNSWACPLLFTG